MMSRAQITDAANNGMFGRGGHLHQDVNSTLNIGRYNPDYEGAQIYTDDKNWWERNISSPVNTYFGNLSQRAPEFVQALETLTPVGLVVDLANGDTENVLLSSAPVRPAAGKNFINAPKGRYNISSANRSMNASNYYGA